MNNLQIFKNPEFGSIRTTEVNSTPYFVGKDVAEILGYSNASKAVSAHVDDEDRQFVMLDIADTQNGNVLIGQSKTAVINESGLYSLILSSKLPNAKKFKRWVTSEVLPSIRKTGGYINNEDLFISTYLPNADEHTKQMFGATLKEMRHLNEKIAADKPKVIFADAVATAKTSILIGDLAKLLKQNGVETGQKRLFDWLRNNGYLIKGGSSKNMPTQKSMELGLFEVKETTINNSDGSIRVTKTTKVTGKGQSYFINKFLAT